MASPSSRPRSCQVCAVRLHSEHTEQRELLRQAVAIAIPVDVATKTPSDAGDEQPTQIAMTQTQTQVQQVQQAFTELDELLTKRNATTSEDDGDNDNVDGSKKQKTWGSYVNYYHHPYDRNN
jgi:predicted HNH restriction endonuclease